VTNLANISPNGVFAAFDIITIADTDRDGMSDAFEIAYGLNTNNVNDAAGDLDGDTMTNLEESLAGTDPSNASSYLRVDNSRLPGATVLQVAAVSNRTYSVQFTDELHPTGASAWSKAADIVARETNRLETLTVTNSTPRRFWRVVLPAQP